MNKIEINNTKDEVANIIKREIIAGRLTSEATITQNYIAEKFGLSRMPIREAFNVLVQEGFLIKHNNRKLSVVSITTATLRHYTRMLTSMELDLLFSELEQDPSSPLVAELNASLKNSNATQGILDFHTLLSDSQNDAYIQKCHYNLLNGLFLHSMLYCDVDNSKVTDLLQQVVESIQSTENLNRDILHSMLLEANTLVVNQISQVS